MYCFVALFFYLKLLPCICECLSPIWLQLAYLNNEKLSQRVSQTSFVVTPFSLYHVKKYAWEAIIYDLKRARSLFLFFILIESIRWFLKIRWKLRGERSISCHLNLSFQSCHLKIDITADPNSLYILLLQYSPTGEFQPISIFLLNFNRLNMFLVLSCFFSFINFEICLLLQVKIVFILLPSKIILRFWHCWLEPVPISTQR